MHPEEGLAKGGGCMALCRGVTSHAVHISGTAAGTGFFCNTSRWAQTCLAAPHPPALPSSHSARVPPSFTTPILRAKQKEMHC